MDYLVLAETYEKLESVSSKLKKTEILAEFFKKTPTDELPKVVLLIQGIVFPKFTGYELGIAVQMMIRAISKTTGYKSGDVENKFKKNGDLGLAVEELIKAKKQTVLFKKRLTLDFVFKNLQQLAFVTGEGSQEKKLNLIAELLASAQPKEARYIVRTVLEELRVGVAEGIIRDAVVDAFLFKPHMSKEKKQELTDAVNYSWNIVSDFGEVAKIAKEKGVEGLKNVKVQLGKPIQVMLGEKAESMKEVFDEFHKLAVEYKYDGMRAQIHKKGNEFRIYTRRLEDVTKQFPDLIKLCREGLNAKECIVEGEVLGINSKTKQPLPFQILSQRIHRKYEIEHMAKEIPIQMNLFDTVYLDGKLLIYKPFIERRKILEKIVKQIPGKFLLAKQLVTDDWKKAEKFYKLALKDKQEGAFLKVLDSKYVFGRHVGGWMKIKPEKETLDCVVVAAQWGEGARASWLTSYVLAVEDLDTGKLLKCGMMSTGLSEEEYKDMTQKLKSLIINEKGRMIFVKPKIILEIGYQEIQKSPNYTSGFALRFPRFIRERTLDKPDPDTLERLKILFESQGRKK